MRLILLLLCTALCTAATVEQQFIHWRDLATADTRDNGDTTVTIKGPVDTLIKVCNYKDTYTRINKSGRAILIVPKSRLLYLSFITPVDYKFTSTDNAIVIYQIYGIYDTSSDITITVH